MSATIVAIADDVVTQLNAGTFSQAITAARKWQPQATLEQLSTAVIHVVPRKDSGERASRSQFEHQYELEIGIRKKLTAGASEAGDEAELDGLVLLGEEIIDFWKTRKANTSYDLFDFDQPFPVAEEMKNQHRIGGVMFTLTFRGWR